MLNARLAGLWIVAVNEENLAPEFEVDTFLNQFVRKIGEECFQAGPAFRCCSHFVLPMFAVMVMAGIVFPMSGNASGRNGIAVKVDNQEIVNLAFEWNAAR